MSITITQVARIDDGLHGAFVRLLAELSPDRVPPTHAELEQIVTSGPVRLLVARHPDADSPVVGTLSLIFYRVPTGLRARIEDLVVLSQARGLGIGRALMLHAIALAREQKAHVVDLTCNPRRIQANHLYQRLGFRKWDTNVYRLVLDD
jgi:ribosomal protein S18 acetylase RimI-like enzyme